LSREPGLGGRRVEQVKVIPDSLDHELMNIGNVPFIESVNCVESDKTTALIGLYWLSFYGG
jgi:hypothetical protein